MSDFAFGFLCGAVIASPAFFVAGYLFACWLNRQTHNDDAQLVGDGAWPSFTGDKTWGGR